MFRAKKLLAYETSFAWITISVEDQSNLPRNVSDWLKFDDDKLALVKFFSTVGSKWIIFQPSNFLS